MSSSNPNRKHCIYPAYGFTLLLFLHITASHGQDAQELDRRNGFKSIKLASPIDSVKGAILKKSFLEKEEFTAQQYETAYSDYLYIGEVAVKDIQLMTYKNLIYKIVVTAEKDPRLMKALEKSYGKSVYVVRTATFSWKGENVSLTFSTHRNNIVLVYRSYPIFKMMNEDKGKKLKAIAEDF